VTACHLDSTDSSGDLIWTGSVDVSMCVKQNNNSVIVNITGVNPVIYDMMPEYLGLFLALYSRIRALQLSNGRSMRLLAHGIYVGRDWSDLAFLYAGIALFLVYVAVVKWRVTPTTSQTSIGCVPNVDGGQNCFAAVAGQPGECATLSWCTTCTANALRDADPR
jgi:hypothetical protein